MIDEQEKQVLAKQALESHIGMAYIEFMKKIKQAGYEIKVISGEVMLIDHALIRARFNRKFEMKWTED